MARNADGAPAAPVHEPLAPDAIGVPYFLHEQGPDGAWWWARCPRCGALVKDDDGYGPGRHWFASMAAETREGIQ